MRDILTMYKKHVDFGEIMHKYSDVPTFKTLQDIKDKKITVMGLGLNGGGESTVKFFLKHGAYVTVTDLKSQEELQSTIDSINADTSIDTKRLTYVLGKHDIKDFEQADCVIKNPGVKFENNKYLAVAKNIETDLSLFLHFTHSPIIAVTGSKGKSSTVSAIHHILKEGGYTTFLGGNITVSPLNFLEQTNKNTPVVLELSSWQLSDLRGRKLLKPFISIITLIVSDHQNWYHSMEKYVEDKKLIYADQNKDSYLLCNLDDDWGKIFAQETKAQVIWYGKEKNTDLIEELSVPGQHMRLNVTTAALACFIYGMKKEDIKIAAKTFAGIPHRLEYFYEYNVNSKINIKFYNDSAATVPEAASAALDAFDNNLHFITGGTDKECDFLPLAQNLSVSMNKKLQSLWLLSGSGTDKLIPLLKQNNIDYQGPYNNVETLLAELKNYLQLLSVQKTNNFNNHTVLFSPGATSFGMFKNEFDRGNTWKNLVVRIFEEHSKK